LPIRDADDENRFGTAWAAEVDAILVARVQFRRIRTPAPLANISNPETRSPTRRYSAGLFRHGCISLSDRNRLPSTGRLGRKTMARDLSKIINSLEIDVIAWQGCAQP
jgi:hypothetical protein